MKKPGMLQELGSLVNVHEKQLLVSSLTPKAKDGVRAKADYPLIPMPLSNLEDEAVQSSSRNSRGCTARFPKELCNDRHCTCSGVSERQRRARPAGQEPGSESPRGARVHAPLLVTKVQRLDNVLCKCHQLLALQPAMIRGTPVQPPWLWDKNGTSRKVEPTQHTLPAL